MARGLRRHPGGARRLPPVSHARRSRRVAVDEVVVRDVDSVPTTALRLEPHLVQLEPHLCHLWLPSGSGQFSGATPQSN
jgi:hypothetical protein